MVKCKHGYSRAPRSEHISVAAKDLGQDPKSIRHHLNQWELGTQMSLCFSSEVHNILLCGVSKTLFI